MTPIYLGRKRMILMQDENAEIAAPHFLLLNGKRTGSFSCHQQPPVTMRIWTMLVTEGRVGKDLDFS